jgi:hypothetical protein
MLASLLDSALLSRVIVGKNLLSYILGLSVLTFIPSVATLACIPGRGISG